ncbi:MAG: hypothetical protein M1839_008724 [Geoglossum umbratile]|nr:MAG: hypothetical protein M1839_008724 [Geoglossum umbratile]
MASDPKGKKRKAAPTPANSAKKLKNSAAMSSKAATKGSPTAVEGNPESVALATSRATRKRAADFFNGVAASESEDGGWDQLDSSKASSSKNSKLKKALATKPGAEISKARSKTKKLKVDVANAEEQQVEEATTRHEGEGHALKPELNGLGLLKEPRKSKKPKIGETAVQAVERAPADKTKGPAVELKVAKSEGAKKSKTIGALRAGKSANSQQKAVEATLPEAGSGESNDEEEEDDDRTIALLKGFESSGDEGESLHEDFIEGQAIPGLPKEKKTRKKLKGVEKVGSDTPGVIYVGRIPHGFYEREMRSYFTQFGEILRLRLSRNKKTGRSKHYAFIEFASSEVARIVAETMDNYLMFGHILKCKTVPQEQVHENLWKGANKRFKKIPRNRIEGKKLEVAASKESWDKRVKIEGRRRKEKLRELKAIGYEFHSPSLKMAKDIEKKEETKLITGGSETDVAQGEATVLEEGISNMIVVSEGATSKKPKKAVKKPETQALSTVSVSEEAGAIRKKRKAKELEVQVPNTTIVSEEADAKKKKKKTEKKAKPSKTEDPGHAASTIKVGEKQRGKPKPSKTSKKE